MPALPSGTVTLLFTDIEGSTRLLQALGGDRYADALAAHQRLLRAAFAAHGGREVDTQGDAFFVAFPRALDAVQAAVDAQRASERSRTGARCSSRRRPGRCCAMSCRRGWRCRTSASIASRTSTRPSV